MRDILEGAYHPPSFSHSLHKVVRMSLPDAMLPARLSADPVLAPESSTMALKVGKVTSDLHTRRLT